MPRKAATISPQDAVRIVEDLREKRRTKAAAYRQRKVNAGARTVQVFVPDEPGARLLRQVAAAMRDGDSQALGRLADQVRAYQGVSQPSLDLGQ